MGQVLLNITLCKDRIASRRPQAFVYKARQSWLYTWPLAIESVCVALSANAMPSVMFPHHAGKG